MKLILLAGAIALSALSLPAHAQSAAKKPGAHKTKKIETQAELMKEAKISMRSAKAIALAKVPGATLESGEIERENGRLIYSFDLKTPGRAGIDEVNVDAITGKLVGRTQHETPKTERKETKQEAKEKAKK